MRVSKDVPASHDGNQTPIWTPPTSHGGQLPVVPASTLMETKTDRKTPKRNAYTSGG